MDATTATYNYAGCRGTDALGQPCEYANLGWELCDWHYRLAQGYVRDYYIGSGTTEKVLSQLSYTEKPSEQRSREASQRRWEAKVKAQAEFRRGCFVEFTDLDLATTIVPEAHAETDRLMRQSWARPTDERPVKRKHPGRCENCMAPLGARTNPLCATCVKK